MTPVCRTVIGRTPSRPRQPGDAGDEPADLIDVRDLPEDKMRAPVPPRAPANAAPALESASDQVLAAEERQAILDALEACSGNQTHAARVLGMSRRTLINRNCTANRVSRDHHGSPNRGLRSPAVLV